MNFRFEIWNIFIVFYLSINITIIIIIMVWVSIISESRYLVFC